MGAPVEEVGVEDVDVAVVVPERLQALDQAGEPVLDRLVGGRPVLVVVERDVLPAVGAAGDVVGVLRVREVLDVLRGVHQPAGPGGDVDDQADHHQVDEGGYAVGQQRLRDGERDPERAARARAPGHDEDPERRQRVDSLPLAAAGQAPADAGDQQPRPEEEGADRPPAVAADLSAPRVAPCGRGTSRGRGPGSARRRAGRRPRRCRAVPAATARTPCRRSCRISPATHPSRVEPVSRRTNRIITRIISVPITAGTTRQPSGVKPNSFSPSPISHLPTSGWTAIEASGFQRSVGLSRQDVLVGDAAVVVDVVARVAEVPQRPGVLGVVGLVELEGVGRARASRGGGTATAG